MKLFSVTGIIISIFFILSVYILVTSQMGYRNKIIIMILLFILGMTIFMNLDIFQNYNRLITNVTDATQTSRIPKDTLIPNSGNYSISTWIYIDDWNYKFGEKKTVLKRENAGKKQNPHIYLDPYNNDITVEFAVKDSSSNDLSNNYDDAVLWCRNNTVGVSAEVLECNYDSNTDEYNASTTGVKCNNDTYECLDGTSVNIDNNTCSSVIQSSTLKNIPIQKWFNVIYGFGDNHTDIYLNGKLVQTKTFNGVQYMDESENADFLICSNGGYSGSISRTSHYNFLVSPDKAYNIYNEGFNSVVVGSLFSKYKAAITFYEDNNERSKYYIV